MTSLGHVVIKGRIAAHGCGVCGGVVYGLCIDGGDVPKFIECRNPDCDGIALIDPFAYPPQDQMVCWEWYRPSYLERQKLKVTDPEVYAAVEHGELALRLRKTPMAKGEHVIVG